MKLAILMDPIDQIHYHKDTSLGMLLEAQKRQWSLSYFEAKDLYSRDGEAWGNIQSLTVQENPENYYQLGETTNCQLSEFDVILMRKDPPFDMQYIYSTYLLELAEKAGCLVINRPQSLRDANEKLFITQFPQCIPPTLVSKNAEALKQFVNEHSDVILKPLHGMGGLSVFLVKTGDPNLTVIIETLSQLGTEYIMAQTFIKEVIDGDKRVLMLDGEPIPYALARIPPKGEIRANLAAGGRGKVIALTQQDKAICQQVAPTLKKMGLSFVGLDIIGDYLTEINVTSPTCLREISKDSGIDIASQFFDMIEEKLADNDKSRTA